MIQEILIVDSDQNVRAILAAVLKARGYNVTLAASGEDALSMAENEKYNMIIIDILLPGIDGRETKKLIREKQPDANIVLLTGYDIEDEDDTILKSTDINNLASLIESKYNIKNNLSIEVQNARLLANMAGQVEILIDTIMPRVERHLTTINGSLKEHDKLLSKHSGDIQVQKERWTTFKWIIGVGATVLITIIGLFVRSEV